MHLIHAVLSVLVIRIVLMMISPFRRWPKGTMFRAVATLQIRWRQLVRQMGLK